MDVDALCAGLAAAETEAAGQDVRIAGEEWWMTNNRKNVLALFRKHAKVEEAWELGRDEGFAAACALLRAEVEGILATDSQGRYRPRGVELLDIIDRVAGEGE